MKKILAMLGVLAVVFVMLAVQSWADIIDNFDSYATGNLSAVSGGKWNTWMGTATDAQVTATGLSAPNAILFDATHPDVVTYSNVNLFKNGSAALSFDFFIPAGNPSLKSAFFLGSGNPLDNSINYSSQVTEIVIGYGPSGNEVHLWGVNFGSFPLLTTVSLDTWHHLNLDAQATGSFDISIDGGLLGDDLSFGVLTDPLGLNAIEIWSSGPASSGGHLYDNISLTGSSAPVPELSTLLLLGSGLAGLAGIKKRFKT